MAGSALGRASARVSRLYVALMIGFVAIGMVGLVASNRDLVTASVALVLLTPSVVSLFLAMQRGVRPVTVLFAMATVLVVAAGVVFSI